MSARNSFRVLVTGSRTWTDEDTIREAMRGVGDMVLGDKVLGFYDSITLVVGGAKGADKIAENVAREWGWRVELHIPDWNQHAETCPDWHEGEPRCRAAGFRRNKRMVDSGVDLGLAFVKDHSAGATGCAVYAESQGVKMLYWRE